MLNALIIGATLGTGAVLLHPRLASNPTWRATITPLASIIGSGFLVLGPILDNAYGYLAPLIMGALCLIAYLFGGAIRFNIARLDARQSAGRSPVEDRLEALASWALALAYIVSVSYYLNLFGAFGVSLTTLNDDLHARLLTSAVLVLILIVGWTHGFSALERMEQVTVGVKLAIIVGLLFGLGSYFLHQGTAGALVVNPATLSLLPGATLAFGLIVTVQGFETSRYLGENYDAATRIRSMKLAQGIATLVYMIYIGFLAYLFAPGTLDTDETAIIGMMEIVAPVLPVLLVAAALSAQFSAAVADTGGSGGLLTELTRGRLSARQAYALIVGIGLLITWTANVFQIISYASRAFALYYCLQAAIAACGAWNAGKGPLRAGGYGALAVLGGLIAAFGSSVE